MKLVQLLVSTSLVVFSFGIIQAQNTVVEKYGKLKVTGSHVTAEDGSKISLAGMSLFWSIAGDSGDFYNKEAVSHLVNDWKISVIRIAMGVNEDWDNGTSYIDNPDLQKKMITKVIDAAIDNGIYVIIDWHTHAAENYTNQAVAFFSEMATLYKNTDNVIFEIYNEPINQSWQQIKDYSNKVIAAIREAGADNLIIVGTPFFSQEVDKPAADPLNDTNVAYTLHFYANTHQKWLRDRAKRAMDDGIALFVTEWGTVNASGNGGFNKRESEEWINFMKANNISHANWSLSHKAESASVVLPGQNVQGLIDNKLTESGILVKRFIQNQAVELRVLSIKDFRLGNAKVKILPNPVKDILKIETTTPIENVTLYNLLGTEVYNKTLGNSFNPKINISNLLAGIYVLKIEGNNKTAITKLIKI